MSCRDACLVNVSMNVTMTLWKYLHDHVAAGILIRVYCFSGVFKPSYHPMIARTCYEWSSHHHGNPLMSADNWSEDAEGIPCSYVDQFSPLFQKSWAHNLTFNPASYSTEPEV